MDESSVTVFRHRENPDGTWDSICLRCYATAAHTHAHPLLTAIEEHHHCDETNWLFRGLAAVRPRMTALPAFGGAWGPTEMVQAKGHGEPRRLIQERLRFRNAAELRNQIPASEGSAR